MQRLLQLISDLWDAPYSRSQTWRILAEKYTEREVRGKARP